MTRFFRKAVLLVLVIVLFPLWSCLADDGVFLRVDRDDPDAWRQELANVRFLTDEHMSGSAQFSVDQFRALVPELRKQAENLWIVDCRLETHGFINGIAVSWCNGENNVNAGKTAQEVEAEEETLPSLTGTTVTAYTTKDNQPVDSVEYTVETWETERAVVEAEGLHYLRLACPDHCWPPAEIIDGFIAFAAGLDENTWLHFHCQAGSGRTGAFMTIFEMMQKPGVPVETILQHQADTGSGNLVDRAAPEKSHVQKERCVLARAMWLYIQENRETGYAMKWSEWLEAHSRTVTMQIGDKLEGNGFSSDPLVMTDSLEAVSAGTATVLSDHTVLNITVR